LVEIITLLYFYGPV